MRKVKILIAFTLLFIVVGIAAVTTNLIINVSTPIASNQDDFLVYFSAVKVNGTQDLSLVKSEKELVFNSEFSAVGDKVIINYDVTNASKNYDATISISCTESNNYLNVTNNFDQKSNLLARSTRTGTLTVELTNAVSQETSYEIKCTITGTAVERETQGSGEVNLPLEKTSYAIGEEITIANETFNVIRDNGDTITMLAQYNLGTNYQQSETENSVIFSNTKGWAYTPGPKDIDIQQYDGNVKTYINEYVSYLKNQTGDLSLTGTLMILSELKSLGCTINDDYSGGSNLTCANSEHKSWLVNGQYWWTRSAYPGNSSGVWIVRGDGTFSDINYDLNDRSVRPVITLSKETLKQQ